MASIIGKLAGEVTQTIVKGQSHDILQGPLNKSWRALLLLNRATSKMPKIESIEKGGLDDLNHHVATWESTSIAQDKDQWTRDKRQSPREKPDQIVESKKVDYTKKPTNQTINNQIVIINKNVSPPISIVLQNRPNSIQVNPMSYWVSVKSMGRNNPFMIYTGGEDSIQLEVSWFVNDPNNREEVLTKCRLLESWTKADGYRAAPPTLKIVWGSSNIFDNDTFILESAPYQLSNFQNSYRLSRDSSQVDLGLLPQCATQTLTFKRVTANNRTHVEMVSMESLQKTQGIKVE